MNAQYVNLYIQTLYRRILNMYTCTVIRLLGNCSICIHVHSDRDNG